MKNGTEYSEYNDEKIENYINYKSEIIATKAEPIWDLKHVYLMYLISDL